MTEKLRKIRQALFARRNGVVASALKANGDRHELILGCLLSDIISVAREQVPSVELAEALWADKKHRECRLLATMLYPIVACDDATALRWCHETLTEEEADVLCHRLLRHMDCALTVMSALLAETTPLLRYTAFRLMLNLVMLQRLELDQKHRLMVETELTHATSNCLRQVLSELIEE